MIFHRIAACTLALVACLSQAAHAADEPLALTLYLRATSSPHATIDDDMLDNMRGGVDWQSNDISSVGNVAQNQATNITTGSNFVNGSSFTSASGFPTVVQNSGNNVLIQNSTIINLQLQ